MDSLECDVLIVGGRVAGSILATVLGTAGHEVVVVDRARFPSPTASTHFFRGADGVAALEHVGVLGDVLALGPPRLACQYDHIQGQDAPRLSPPQDPGEVGFCLSVRREPLDDILVRRAAREPTVRVLQGTRLTELKRTNGRVTGAVLSADGEVLDVRSRFTVGADGRRSTVAERVQPELELSDAPARALFYQYVRGFPSPGSDPGPEFSILGDEIAYVFPSDDGVTLVAASVNLETFEAIRRSLSTSFAGVISRHEGITERFKQARPISKVLGCGPEPHYVRRPWGNGWALVGDASIHQDPWSGRGIDFAGTHARYLGEALTDTLSGRVDESAALQAYWKRRDQHALAGYRETNELAKDLRQIPAS
ncbi:MAG: NAD(P)/FAD-dependent oxidoreductase [Solirubrobacteraceae bacterium]